MRRIGLVLGITAATLVLQTGAFAAGYVWLEAENTASTNLKPNVAGWGRKQFLSEEKWLHVSIDAGKVDAELPAEGGLLGYAFTLDGDGAYEVWNRIGFEFVRSPFDWRLDGGEWHRVAPDALTTDLMELQTWCEVAWLKLADVPLKAGPHTLDIRLPKTQDEKGGTARVLYALDVVCIHDGRFRPNGAHRPDADTRSARDREAEARVVELPGTAAAEARASVGLDGLWEVCRDDEQLPAEVAAAISRLPENPIWRAIDVPGDKNALRPDLIFCHRFWYRTRVRVPEALAGRSFFLVFPQNNLNTTVYVNGVLCGFDKNPFARVQIDVSKGIRAGQVNEVWVGIRDAYYGFSTSPNDPMKLRRLFNYPLEWSNHGFMDLAYPVWNHFQSGILATPRLVAAGSTYVSDVFCKPSVAKRALALEVSVVNSGDRAFAGELVCEAVSEATGAVAKTFAPVPVSLGNAEARTIELAEPWSDPALWWPDQPALYRLRTTLRAGGMAADTQETTFGFREWTAVGNDFLLNGIPWHGWADCHTAATPEEWLANYRAFNQTLMRFWGTTWQGLPPENALSFFDRNGVVVRRSGLLDGEAIGYWAIERDPALKALYGSEIKMQLMQNWQDQVVAQVRGERNHPSVMTWSIENEWLYINCINLYGGLMDGFEAEVSKVSDAVRAVDPTRFTMVDGGGATKAQTLPVHGDHYVAGNPWDYPELAYQANPKGGGRGRWEWDRQRPRFLGEDFYMTGNHPEVSYFQGEAAFAGKPRAGVAIWNRMLQEGYRWAEYGAWHFWLGQHDTDRSQYTAFAPRAVLCREWDWTFAAGTQVPRTFGVFNDTRHPDPITFDWALTSSAGLRLAGASRELRVPPGRHEVVTETLAMPAADDRLEATLVLRLSVNRKVVFEDTKPVSILRPRFRGAGARPGVAESSPGQVPGLGADGLLVFDPNGEVAGHLGSCGVPFTRVEMARYIVTYADGSTAAIPVCAELDVDDYCLKAPTSLPGAQLAWTRSYDGTDLHAAAYCMPWTNPRPDAEIRSLDLVYGEHRRGVPALIAVTVATGER